ncbi:MAG: hypothetical protein C0594_11895 [Marinilabiliales bacterium]|nr:MAG: hypothetical protein C0594_11895 [Marinilabiliales bacterium]
MRLKGTRLPDDINLTVKLCDLFEVFVIERTLKKDSPASTVDFNVLNFAFNSGALFLEFI